MIIFLELNIEFYLKFLLLFFSMLPSSEIPFQENVIVWLFVDEENIDYRKRNFRKFYFLSSNLQENY